MAVVQPIPRTHLSLHRYAQLLGINPVHFAGGYGDNVWPLKNNNCSNIWVRYAWQNADQLSHVELANTIKAAEDDIAEFLGHPVAPQWIDQEIGPYPQFHRPDWFGIHGRNARGQRKSTRLRWGKVIQAGRRGTELIESDAAVVYTDENTDGFAETATITVSTTLTDNREIKVFFAGKNASELWEVRPVRDITIDAIAGTATIVIDAWLLLDPEVLSYEPTWDTPSPPNVEQPINFVTTVDVYRVYADTVSPSAQFYWQPPDTNLNLLPITQCTSCSGTGCPACLYKTQDGCAIVTEPEMGYAVPVPAEYDATDERWEQRPYAECRDPDLVKIWYQAGEVDNEYKQGNALDPLSNEMAWMIAMLATSRLERPFCNCSNTSGLQESWREDLAFTGNDSSFLVEFSMLANPFGTRRGEMQVFRRLGKIRERLITGASI